MTRLTTAFIATFISTLSIFGQGVVINEIHTGDPDSIEISNLTGQHRDISGWSVTPSMYYTVYPTTTIPAGTILAPGQSLLIIEAMAPAPPTLAPDALLHNSGVNWGWVGNSTGTVALTDNNGTCRDYVVFGTGGHATPAVAANQSFTAPISRSGNSLFTDDVLMRQSLIDTDSGADWINLADGAETLGTLNPGQDAAVLTPNRIFLSNGAVIVAGENSVAASISDIANALDTMTSDPSSDPLIGGTVTFEGTLSGQDLANFTGVIFSPATLIIETSDGSASLTIFASFQSTGYRGAELIGSDIVRHRELKILAGTSQFSGDLSPALLALHDATSNGELSLLFRILPNGAELVAVEPTHERDTMLESILSHEGGGKARISVIGVDAPELYNFFAVGSTSPMIDGPLFGLEWGPLQQAIVQLPIGAAPFHVTGDADHVYSYTTPAGLVPAGLVVDHVAVTVDGTTIEASDPMRVIF